MIVKNDEEEVSFPQAERVGNPSEKSSERFRTSRNDRTKTGSGFTEDPPGKCTLDSDTLPENLLVDERPFELWTAADEDFNTAVTLIPGDWTKERRELWKKQLEAIRDNEHICRIEQPVYKRRWYQPDPYKKQFKKAFDWMTLSLVSDLEIEHDAKIRLNVRMKGDIEYLLKLDYEFFEALEVALPDPRERDFFVKTYEIMECPAEISFLWQRPSISPTMKRQEEVLLVEHITQFCTVALIPCIPACLESLLPPAHMLNTPHSLPCP